ncbi:MAG: hypothetical protein ACOYEP_09930 [Limnochordia bacterium]
MGMVIPDRLEARGDIILGVEHVRDLTIAVQPALALRAHTGDGALEIHGVWGDEGAGLGPYSTSAAVGDTVVQVWGGGYRSQRWADDQSLVTLVGVEHGGPRLRIMHGPWGLDYTTERTGVRWQRETKRGAGVSTKAGALVIAGLPPPEPEEESEWDEVTDEVEEDSANDPSQVGLQRGLERGVLFGTYQNGIWRLQGALAAAVSEEEPAAQGGLAWARAVQMRYSPPGWRVEFRHSHRAAGYTKSGAKDVTQLSVTRANGKVGARILWRQESDQTKAPIDSWTLTVGGRPGISAAGIGSVYTLHQVQRAIGRAWRVHVQCQLEPGHHLNSGYPWIWDDASVARWQVSLEGRWPVGQNGGFGARLRLAEAKNGRLSWSYPLFSDGRALSAQSHSGLRLETLFVKSVEPGWRFLSELVVAEEVKHEYGRDELPRASYWAWRPSVERQLSEHVKLTLALGVLMAEEYSGVRVEEMMQLVQLRFIL